MIRNRWGRWSFQAERGLIRVTRELQEVKVGVCRANWVANDSELRISGRTTWHGIVASEFKEGRSCHVGLLVGAEISISTAGVRTRGEVRRLEVHCRGAGRNYDETDALAERNAERGAAHQAKEASPSVHSSVKKCCRVRHEARYSR